MSGLILIKPLESIGYIALNGSFCDAERLITENFLRAAKTEYGSVNDATGAVHPYIDKAHLGEFVRGAGLDGFRLQETV